MRAVMARRCRKLYGLTWGTDLGASRMARKGVLGSGASRSVAGKSKRIVDGTTGLGTGWRGGVDPLRLSQDRTSDTLEMRVSSLGYFDELYCRVCQSMPSSSKYVSVPMMRHRPRAVSWKVCPMRSIPVSVVGLCRVELVAGTGGGLAAL